MMQLIMPERYAEFADDLAEMHRLRRRVFEGRLAWNVTTTDGLEVDEFDALGPAYLLQRGSDGALNGCVRLLPTNGPTMLGKTFASLLDGALPPASPGIWESSRFALDLPRDARKAASGLACATYELFAGMLEFGLAHDLSSIVTVTDARIERILRRAGWPLRRLGEPRTIGTTRALAGYLDISKDHLERIRSAGSLRGPVLWAPVARAAA